MKKSVLISCAVLITFSLMSFAFMNWRSANSAQEEALPDPTLVFNNDFEDPIFNRVDFDIFYNVDSRYIATITKENLHNAKSIIDILPVKATQSIESYQSVQVDVIDKQSEHGEGDVLNTAQLNLLKSADYSTNIYIRADYKIKNSFTGDLQDRYLTYFISVIPEKVAEFTDGHDALIEYLKESSKAETAIIKQNMLRPGKVSFTVTQKGSIANAKLTSTSGYPSVDEKLVELISTMPGKWNPATNSKGEKVDQELVFFFGLEGC